MKQLAYLLADYRRLLGRHRIRALVVWTTRGFMGIALYRFERSGYLSIGNSWSIVRLILLPLLLPLYAYANADIHYRADIGPGIKIMHSSLGLVVSKHAVIGRNVTFTGGNVVGARQGAVAGSVVIGDNCFFGPNACVIGPCRIGDHVNIAAGSVAVRDCVDDITLVGVPASGMKRASQVSMEKQ